MTPAPSDIGAPPCGGRCFRVLDSATSTGMLGRQQDSAHRIAAPSGVGMGVGLDVLDGVGPARNPYSRKRPCSRGASAQVRTTVQATFGTVSQLRYAFVEVMRLLTSGFLISRVAPDG